MNNQKRNTWLFLGFMVLAAAANCLSRLLESEWAALMTYVITKGYNLEYFDPGRDCTREDMTTFFWRLAGQPEPKTTSSAFPDKEREPGDGSLAPILRRRRDCKKRFIRKVSLRRQLLVKVFEKEASPVKHAVYYL